MRNKNIYKLAVIIPCWNCESYIGELLDCLLSQTLSDWRAFLVDDGCTDSTAIVIKNYALRDSRLNYVLRYRAPKGAQTCRNIGFELSEGAEYVIFIDADDLIAPYCLEQRVRFLQTHSSVDFASFPMKAFKTDKYDDTYWGFGVQGEQELILSLLYWKTLQIVVPSNIYRRERLVDVDLRWDERLHSMQDADFNIQSLTKGLIHSFSKDDRIDYFYRQGQSTVSKRIFDSSMFASHLYLIEKVINSIRAKYQSKYDFYLKAYIVNFFELFQKNRTPYLSIMKLDFVKKQPGFFLRIAVLLLLGMRGKNRLFSKYVHYSVNSAKQWSVSVNEVLRKKVTNEMIYGN